MKYWSICFGFAIVIIFTYNGSAQTNRTCSEEKENLKGVEYVVAATERVPRSPELPESNLIYAFVENRDINSEKLRVIAAHLKQRYCNENRIVVMLFDNLKQAKRFNPDFKASRDALRGTYVFNKLDGEEYISFVPSADYFGNPDKRITIKLN